MSAQGAISWINAGEKYAAIALSVNIDNSVQSHQLPGNISLVCNPIIPIDQHWREWLGTIAIEHLEDSNILLLAKMPSQNPDVLDHENELLKQHVWNAYIGLLLSCEFALAHKPLLITGGYGDGAVGIRQNSEIDPPVPDLVRPYPPVSMAHFEEAARLGRNLSDLVAANLPGGHWRLLHTLHIYAEARATRDILDRLHQYSRCIDGLILPAVGNTKAQFRSKTELFIGPTHHAIMGEIYDARSAVEHLNDNRYLEVFNRATRLDLLKKQIFVGHIARTALQRVFATQALWPHFANQNSLGLFWLLSLPDRQQIWGNPIDPTAALAEFDPAYINNATLGAQ